MNQEALSSSAPFFDRERELQQLETAWAAPGAQLVTLWGRRRVGKSTLLGHFASDKRAVYLYGTRIAERDVLHGLALQAAVALDDPYLRFWFRFVSPYQSYLQLGTAVELWRQEIEPELDAFVGRTTWEAVCGQHLWRLQADGQLPVRFAQLGRWWDDADELDLVGLWDGHPTVVGECKWTRAPMDEGDFAALQVKARKLPLAGAPLWVLASRSGFSPQLQRQAADGGLLLVTPDAIFSHGEENP